MKNKCSLKGLSGDNRGFPFLRKSVRLALTALAGLFAAANVAHGQGSVSVAVSGQPVTEVFRLIEQQTNYVFFYREDMKQDLARPVTIRAESQSVSQVLDKIFENTDIVYEISQRQILIYRKEAATRNSPVQRREVTGTVYARSGGVLAGASIMVKGSQTGVVADARGQYRIMIPDRDDVVLSFSFLGMDKKEIAVRNNRKVDVTLDESAETMQEVVVTGITTRHKESFTGATSTFTGEQLSQIGNQNLIQSLKTLDPSFNVVEDNLQGSNPNALPSIEVRGQSSISTTDIADQYGGDPNLPLFILDGFETTLQVINDLDMNRVASVTILKDAASTAIYGAKAANGVIVVETLRPAAGELRVVYSGDFRIEMPDLGSYNLMDAREKLEFERQAGRYTASNPHSQLQLDQLYNYKLSEIEKGVDTYWLSEPVRIGFTNGHSVQVTGGSNDLTVAAGIAYKKLNGVMDGSFRQTWGGNVDLTYRRGKINISNKLSVSGYNSEDSPYGSFSAFAAANPYYRKRNEAGEIEKNLEYSVVMSDEYIVSNPLYNATLASYSETDNVVIRNNLQVIWSFTPDLRLQGGFLINASTTEATAFKDPDHTDFAQMAYEKKGTYSNSRSEDFDVQGNLMLIYAKSIRKHQVNGNLRADIQHSRRNTLGISAEGYPLGTNGNPNFSYGYKSGSSPSVSNVIFRRVNLLASLNYNYGMRYLLDLNYRLDGSTAFGSQNKYASFWSAGIGWNLHNEAFFGSNGWLDMLRLRANMGVTGNQNLGSTTSASIYSFMTGSNLFGQSMQLSSLGNPDLEWQNTTQKSIGVDLAFFKSRLNVMVNYYDKLTEPLVIAVSVPMSVGVTSFYGNAGSLKVKGWELNLKYSIIRNTEERIFWNVGIAANFLDSKYRDFGTALDNLNADMLNNSSLVRYYDGYSPYDIWAVVSKGIDPGTGSEVFRKKTGEDTYEYNASDIVKVGSTRPSSEGIITSAFTYKSLTLGINLRYRFGGDVFNSALYNKVENITSESLKSNQDKCALYKRWQNPGDIAEFKRISLRDYTPMSSRFVQKDNQLVGESIQVGWQFHADSWIRHLSMQQLRVNLYMNDIFRLATTKAERGIDYPFSRSVSLSLNVSF